MGTNYIIDVTHFSPPHWTRYLLRDEGSSNKKMSEELSKIQTNILAFKYREFVGIVKLPRKAIIFEHSIFKILHEMICN